MHKIKMLKKLIFFFMIFIFLVITTYSYGFYHNNKDVNRPSKIEIEAALDSSLKWLQNNYKSNHNEALWWLLKQASESSGKQELIEIYREHKLEYIRAKPLNIWSSFFIDHYLPPKQDNSSIARLLDYHKFFAYALSCSKDLSTEPSITKQLNTEFCNAHFLKPHCVTHQLMGIRLLQERGCNDQALLENLTLELSDTIKTELTWDFRVGDAYIQRALMLAISGYINEIKPIWIRRIIDAQNPDGGWDDIHPIVRLPNDNTFGFSSTFPVIKQKKSDFHATAQGISLLGLLLNYDAQIFNKTSTYQ